MTSLYGDNNAGMPLSDSWTVQPGAYLMHNAVITGVYHTEGMLTVTFSDGFTYYAPKPAMNGVLSNPWTIEIIGRAMDLHAKMLPPYEQNEGVAFINNENCPMDDQAKAAIWLRYTFEHTTLPQLLFNDQRTAVQLLFQPGFIYNKLLELFNQNNWPCPYRVDQFQALMGMTSYGFHAIKILLPPPETSGLCYAAYIIYKPGTGLINYGLLERNDTSANPWACMIDVYRQDLCRNDWGDYGFFDDRAYMANVATMLSQPNYLEELEKQSRQKVMVEDIKAGRRGWICSECGAMNTEHIFICKCGRKKSENDKNNVTE